MARRVVRQSQEQKLMHQWWMRVVLALLFVSVGYGFILLAIDSGYLWQYFIGLFFVGWAIRSGMFAVRYIFNR